MSNALMSFLTTATSIAAGHLFSITANGTNVLFSIDGTQVASIAYSNANCPSASQALGPFVAFDGAAGSVLNMNRILWAAQV